MKIYTRSGDDGTTALSGGRRIAKHDLRIEAYGTVDELISWIGLLRSQPVNAKRKDFLLDIQDELMSVTASLAHDKSNPGSRYILPDPECIPRLENEIDLMESRLSPLKSFIIPGGETVVSYCHIARCVCRRAERAVFRLNEKEETPEICRKLLNRLSDYLFVLARLISFETDNEEIKWSV